MGDWNMDRSRVALIEIDWFGKPWQGIEPRLSTGTHHLHPQNGGDPPADRVWTRDSLSMSQAPAQRVLELVRHRLSDRKAPPLEARCDGWREDTYPTRTGAVPSLLARLNSTVVSLMDRLGVRNVARQAHYFDAAVEQAIQLLLTGQCFVF